MKIKFIQNIIDILRGKKNFIVCFGKPKIKNYQETVETLLKTNKSIARYGDGEIALIKGQDIPFQKYDPVLCEKLKNIIANKDDSIMIGINYEYYYPPISKLLPTVKKFYKEFGPSLRESLASVINYKTQYYAAAFTQLYIFFENYDFETHYNQLKLLWENKKILIVTCKENTEKCKFNIFENAKETNFLYIPSINAFSEYDTIYSNILKYDKDTLIILMAGPTASVLAYELSQEGYRALDIGHLAKDYDFYKQKKYRDKEALIDFTKPDIKES